MDTSSPGLIGSVSASTPDSPAKRQYRSAELKRKIVEESLVPGASVARIARAHGVNANRVFAWRRKYQQGLLSVRKQTPRLLPVPVTGASVQMSPSESALRFNPPSGTVQIELAKATDPRSR